MRAALGGNVGIPNIGTVILPDIVDPGNGAATGPVTVTIPGNVREVIVPAAATLREFTVRSLGADTDNTFPSIPPRFFGAGNIVKVTVEKDVTGFTFDVPGTLDMLRVGGDIINSDLTFARNLEKLSVGGDVVDSDLGFAKGVGTVKIVGNLTGSQLHAGKRVEELVVGGNVVGTQIAVAGVIRPGSAALAVALGKLSVGGDVVGSKILAGYDAALHGVNPDAGIGAVKIAGVLRMSDLVAGAGGGVDGIFGTDDDELPSGGRGSVVAKIASIILGGVEGSAAAGDGFGIVAEEIGKLRIGTSVVELTRHSGNDLTPILLGGTDDVRVREVVAVG